MIAGPWRGVRLLACLCFIFAFASPAFASFQLHFFPALFYDFDELSQSEHSAAVWPLYERNTDPHSEERLTAIHPLMSAGSTADGHERFVDFIYPIAGWRRWGELNPDAPWFTRTWLFPLFFNKSYYADGVRKDRTVLFPFFYAGKRTPPGSRYTIIFPFIWDIQRNATFYFPLFSREAGKSFAFWPFWGEFRKFFGADYLWFALWPLWIESDKGENHTQTFIWPFFSRTRGPEINAWRVWPLISHKNRKDVGYRYHYLWPLGYHIRRQATSEYGPELKFDAFLPFYINSKAGKSQLRYYFPFWGEAKSPNRLTVAWLWPLYTKTESTDPEYTQTRILYFLYNRKKGEEIDKTSYFPVFGESDINEPGEEAHLNKRYAFFPFLFERKEQKSTGRRFNRTYFFPFLIDETWRNADGSLYKRREALLPFYRKVQYGDGRKDVSWPHLWWYTELEGVKRNWAPLWTIYAHEEQGPESAETRIFGRLYRSKTLGKGRTEREWNFLIGRYHVAADGEGSFSLFGWEF